jgi:hypothetical protein
MAGYAVVEFHGFRDGNNDFIVKELALVSSSEQTYTLVFFKSPFERSCLDSRCLKGVTWLEKNFHYISWDYGDVQYSEEVMTTLCNKFATIYTKGFEKANFLRRFHPNVKMIGDEAPKSKDNEEVSCPLHTNGGRCALQSALFYMEWLRKHEDYTRESNRLLSFEFSDIPKAVCTTWAKKGFYYDGGKVMCTWCEELVEWHTVCVKGYNRENIPIEFDVIIPLL